MATNNTQTQPTSKPTAKATGLLSGLLAKGEHMIALGCGMLLIVMLTCALGGWWIVASMTTTPADPAPITQVRRGEIEHSSLDRCPAGLTAHDTARGMVCR